MTSMPAVLSRHRVRSGLVLAAVVAVAVPLTAFVIVPQFVRSTVHEAAPGKAISKVDPGASVAPSEQAIVGQTKTLASGDLRQININDFGRGKVLLLAVGSKHFIRFDNVDISAAPAQHVYLSDRSDGLPGAFTDLGALKATSGSFNYEIPPSVDLARVKAVVSYCQQFKVTITYAPLT